MIFESGLRICCSSEVIWFGDRFCVREINFVILMKKIVSFICFGVIRLVDFKFISLFIILCGIYLWNMLMILL